MAVLSNTGIRAGASIVTASYSSDPAENASTIKRSGRFNKEDSAYLSRTPSAAGNRKTWTYSCWIKKTKNGATKFSLFGQGSGAAIIFDDSYGGDRIRYVHSDGNIQKFSNVLYRDNSAWYHIVVVLDTTDGTQEDRLRFYVNNERVTSWHTNTLTALTQNVELGINDAAAHDIGRFNAGNYFDGYIANIHFIDGQALDPSYFGVTNSTTGQWVPGDYIGDYGTNGFHLEMDPANGGIGHDSSGKTNHWTEHNIFSNEATVANDNFNATTYTGTGSTRTVNLTSSFTPDLVWLKQRTNTRHHYVFDSIRGFAGNKDLVPSEAVDEGDVGHQTATYGYVSSVGAGTVTLTNGTSSGIYVNNSGDDYIMWCWKAGGAASANNTGSINASVSANTTAGFSIVSYTGTGSNATVAHGLGQKPQFILVKNRDSHNSWTIFHDSLPATKYLLLDSSAGEDTSSTTFNDTEPTSSVFSVGTFAGTNGSSNNMIAYCWTEKTGISKFGTYEGAGTVTVDCGFTPAFVLIKDIDAAGSWSIFDNARDSDKEINHRIYANEASGDGTDTVIGTFTGSGFTLTNEGNTNWNKTGDTFVYAAFAGNPDGDLDLLTDTPGAPYDNSLNGGGNYPTMNPLVLDGLVLKNGNLNVINTDVNSWSNTRSTMAVQPGEKCYCEVTINAAEASGNNAIVELGAITDNPKDAVDDYLGKTDTSWYWQNNGGTCLGHNNTYTTYGGSSITYKTGDIIGIAIDLSAYTLKYYKNGVDQGIAFTNLPANTPIMFACSLYNDSDIDWNFGQRTFAYSLPAGHKALNAYNLPTPTIVKGNTGFDVKVWEGTGSAQTIPLAFEPDMIWSKTRSHDINHKISDEVRGFSKFLEPDTTIAENTDANAVTATSGSGFTIGTSGDWNTDDREYVGWAWDAGGSNTTKAAGDLNSSAYLQGEVYSSKLTGSGTNSNEDEAFNGLIGDAWDEGATTSGAGAGVYLRFTPSSQVASNTVEVYVNYHNQISFYTGSPGSSTKVAGPFYTTTSGYFTLVDCGTVPAWDYMQIEVPSGVGNLGVYFGGIRIGGKLLVDSNVTPANVPTVSTTYRSNNNTGFSISTHTSPSSGTTYSVAHGLNVRPDFILMKDRDSAGHWQAWHKDLADGHNFYLNITNASAASGTAWPDPPTSTTFYTTANGHWGYEVDLLSYSWSEVAGYSKIGSWLSTGNSFVHCGFKPKFLLAKCTSHTGDWMMYDTERGPLNQDADNNTLVANVSENEDGHYNPDQASVDILSNGFKIRHAVSSPLGDTGRTYIFAAFAESPFKYANAR